MIVTLQRSTEEYTREIVIDTRDISYLSFVELSDGRIDSYAVFSNKILLDLQSADEYEQLKQAKYGIESMSMSIPTPIPTKTSTGYKQCIRDAILRYEQEGREYTYKDIARDTGASLPTVKVWAPKIKKELVS